MQSEIKEQYILLTGGTGFLGSFLSVELLRQGYQIYFLLRSVDVVGDKIKILKRLYEVGLEFDLASHVHVVSGNITQPFCGIPQKWADEQNGKISAVWHLAGLVKFYPRGDLYVTNEVGAKNVVKLAKSIGAHLHYISTAYVAGDSPDSTISEDKLHSNVVFRNFYELSKFNAEKYIRDQITSGDITATIYRPSILIGHSLTGRAFSFTGYYVPLLFFHRAKQFFSRHKFLSTLPIVIPYMKGATLNLIPVDHAVKLISCLARHPKSKNRTFHIVHPHPPEVKFVFKESLKQLGYHRIIFIKLPRLVIKMVASALWVFSYVGGVSGARLRRYIGDYLAYLWDHHIFSMQNVHELCGNSLDIPELDSTFFQRCVTYAIQHNFGRSRSE